MRALAILAVLVAVALVVVAVAWFRSRARADRKSRLRHEAFLADLHKQAIEAMDVDPLAVTFADQIRTHLTTPEKEIPR